MTDIAVNELTKRFGRGVAVDGLTFAAPPGQITGFLGPNGAGKTTTLRAVVGLARPTSGSALVGGRRYADLGSPGRVVGAVLEAGSARPGRTGRDQLRIAARAIGVGDGRVDEVLNLVGLDGAADRRVPGYSMGMRQRLDLASALLGDPEVLILDEPANGLDPEGIAWLRSLLRGLSAEGRTVLISSHLLSEVAQTVDRVVIIDHGRLRFAGSLAELGSGTVSVRAGDAARLRDALRKRGFKVDAAGADGLEVRGATAEQVGRLAADERVALSELTANSASLEAAFLRLTGADETQPAPSGGRSRRSRGVKSAASSTN
jgi:ABC-2 type transport system ATP-binding protein